MLPRQTRGGLETWESKERRQQKAAQEATAQTEGLAPRSFYRPAPGHAHLGTEPIRGLRPPFVQLLRRGARWGRGRGKRRLLERAD